ncbi:MAG: TonB-dependent receptor, partial [Tannerella sp.]|nr:TonB-dependent receptor [Tannerella sp.]
MALQPKDVIRIEYHDNPGLRYGNAEAVVDYIVRRHETGGNLGVNIQNVFKLKQFGNNSINGRINHKKSEFSVNYSVSHRNIYQMWRDNEETFLLADGSVLHRKEAGEPGHLQWDRQVLNTTYSYLNEKRMFNATFRYHADNQPHLDYNGKLYNKANPNDFVQMFDQEKSLSSRPALDLYYQENLKNDQTLVVNVVGTYNYTDNNRVYTESRDGVYLTDINNLITGNKYSWIGEGIYEKKLGNNSLSA